MNPNPILRVLILSWEYPPYLVGGLGVHVAELIPQLAAKGADLTVVTPRWRGGAPIERVHERAVVHRIEPPVPQLLNYYADAQQTNLALEEAAHRLWQEGGEFDLIHAHDWLVSFAAEALKRLHKTPLVATIHATERGRGGGLLREDVSEAINGAEWWLTYEAWRVITTSHSMARELRQFFKLPFDKINVIPNGVDPRRFDIPRDAALAEFRANWALSDEPLIFYVGRIQQEKGVHLLVQAARQLVSEGRRSKFVIAGTGTLLAPLREWVATLGMQDRILLPGYVSDAVRDHLYRAATVSIFPSSYEPFGIVALEAMAAGCPVIVSDTGGLGEVVENGVTGVAIPPDNLAALEGAIRYVLDDPGAAAARAERAFERVCSEYSWERIAEATLDLYRYVIEERAKVHWA